MGVFEMLTETDVAGGLRSGSQLPLMVSSDAMADNAPPPMTSMISTLDMHDTAFTFLFFSPDTRPDPYLIRRETLTRAKALRELKKRLMRTGEPSPNDSAPWRGNRLASIATTAYARVQTGLRSP